MKTGSPKMALQVASPRFKVSYELLLFIGKILGVYPMSLSGN